MAGPEDTYLPEHWVGWWIAEDGKAILIERRRTGLMRRLNWHVTVAPSRGEDPYLSAPPLRGPAYRIARRQARCQRDEHGRYWEIEGGEPGLGPTYRLYPVVDADGGAWRKARDEDPVDNIVLLPNTVIGLYDDYEDDVGAPWATPLLALRRGGSELPL